MTPDPTTEVFFLARFFLLFSFNIEKDFFPSLSLFSNQSNQNGLLTTNGMSDFSLLPHDITFNLPVQEPQRAEEAPASVCLGNAVINKM
ncbi:hypothetical protein BofuT4_uP130950.1 [Botrytis cinerea T4]|uniref:Uncharacterized protein n=1 Tax=Botryotinia fuckeliana (strain T4) TaxID=999810 RepID=G2YQL7_BOTF4|nr:hypothetical protein BofuT4_uP130950.1 [Botrytis cinerea T4]